jgi:hypothetical protein
MITSARPTLTRGWRSGPFVASEDGEPVEVGVEVGLGVAPVEGLGGGGLPGRLGRAHRLRHTTAVPRRGYVSEILCRALIVARAEGVERALLTCDDNDAASQRVIERCGGVLEDVRLTEAAE